MSAPADWKLCTRACSHRGPYYVEYIYGTVEPFYVGPDGAQAGWAIETAPTPVRVLAPQHPRP